MHKHLISSDLFRQKYIIVFPLEYPFVVPAPHQCLSSQKNFFCVGTSLPNSSIPLRTAIWFLPHQQGSPPCPFSWDWLAATGVLLPPLKRCCAIPVLSRSETPSWSWWSYMGVSKNDSEIAVFLPCQPLFPFSEGLFSSWLFTKAALKAQSSNLFFPVYASSWGLSLSQAHMAHRFCVKPAFSVVYSLTPLRTFPNHI